MFKTDKKTKLHYFFAARQNAQPRNKASFIDKSSIASLKLFLIAWLREYRTFSDSSVVSL